MPGSSTDSRKQSRAVRRSFFSFHGVHLAAVNIGLNLAPEFRARATSAEPDFFDRNFHLLKNLKRVAKTERHALENRSHNVRASVTRGQSHEGRARARIQMRSALAH